MASRFPSIEEFDDGQTSPTIPVQDPTSLFDREHAALGDDANAFESSAGNFPALEGEDDLLGGGSGFGASSGGGGQFGDAFPELEENEKIEVTGTKSYVPNTNFGDYGSGQAEEPEVIKQWRERQSLEIARRDETSKRRKDEKVQEANKAIDEYYESYNTKKDKAIEQTRKEAEDFLAARENTSSGGTSWERIAKLVDLSDKHAKQSGKADKSRFRDLLQDLRKDENAPGAKGV